MNGGTRRASVLQRVGLLVGCCALPAGCIAPQGKPAETSVQKAEGTPGSAPAAAMGDSTGSLGALEEFLRRTEAYTLNPAASASAKLPPAGPAAPSDGAAPVAGAAAASAGLHSSGGLFPATPAAARRVSASQPEIAADRSGDSAVANARIELGEPAPPARPIPALPVLQSVVIVAAAIPARTETKSPLVDGTVANQSAEATPPAAEDGLQNLLQRLEEKVQTGDDFDAEWQLRLMQLALHRDAEARELSASLPEETRTLWLSLFDVVGVVRSVSRNSAPISTHALQQVDDLRRRLSTRADPEIGAIHLCKRVVTFGSFEEMAADEWVAGRSIQTIVYSELRNVRFEESTEGLFKASLSARLEILTPDGRSVWARDEPQISDTCRRPRSDFFLAQRIVIPATLHPGEYVLKLFVEDKLSSRAAENTTTFRLHPSGSLARKP